ncbi:MAG: hypothetical protein H7233_16835 [Pseudorhodobacter sp.]|nr:hypothetical protein [Frankiaceae bacterium]
MTKTRVALAAGLLSIGLAGPLAGAASAAPACDNPAALIVHTAEEAAGPAGSVTAPAVHSVVEPAVCTVR